MNWQMSEKRAFSMVGTSPNRLHCRSPRSIRARSHIAPPSTHKESRKEAHRRQVGRGAQLTLLSKHQLSIKQRNSTCQDTANSRNRPGNCKAHIVFPHCRRALLATLVASCLLLLICLPQSTRTFFIDERQSPPMSDWNYVDQFKWRQLHRECAGRAQSPIDIQHKNVIVSQHLRLRFYNYGLPLKFKLSNAHHTIKMNPIGGPYDDEGDTQHRHGPAGSFNLSSIHDMITADEYVEFPASNTNQQQQQQQQQQQGHEGAVGDATNSLLADSQSQVDKERLVSLAAAFRENPLSPQNRVNLNNGPHQTGSSKKNDANNDANNAYGADKGRLYSNSNSNNNYNANPNEPNHVEHDGDDGERADSWKLAGRSGLGFGGAPTIRLNWLDDGHNEYKLRDIHFHWGERRDNGSEHAIDGRRAAMEMHLVHIRLGLDKSQIGYTSDSVAVISVLIESHRKSNADFNPIVNELARINSTEEAREIDYKSLMDLLPSNLDAFYTYSGSLTTPPCYQVVNWIVMAERLNMNAKQIEMFRSLYAPPSDEGESDEPAQGVRGHGSQAHSLGHHANKWPARQGANKPVDPYSTKNQSFQSLSEPSAEEAAGSADDQGPAHGKWPEMIMPNIRSIQEVNNRTILASFNKYGSRLKAVISHSPSVHTGHELNLLLVTSVLASLLGSCVTPLLVRSHTDPVLVR